MNSFFRFFVERHTLAYVFTLMVIVMGFSTAIFIKRDQYPKVEFGELFITTYYPGASPEDVELNVTNKLEEELKTITGIDRYTSISLENVSFLDVVIESDVEDLNDVINEVREAVGRVTDFPPEVTDDPLITELKTSIFPVIEVGLSGNIPYAELREYAHRFEKKLKEVKGVARLKEYGYRAREIKIEVSPNKMREYQLSLREIVAAIQSRNIRAAGGSLESYTSEKNLVTMAEFREPMEVGDVIVRTTFEGPHVKVKDLAIVTDDFETERMDSRMNGISAISYVVDKSEAADVIRTVERIKALVEKEKKNLPEGVDILYSSDASRGVKNIFDIVKKNGLIGLGLVVILLAMFLNVRIAFWVALGIPVALLGTVFLLPFFNAYLDGIVLSSMIIVLGIIIDDGIIISENIYHRREMGDSPLEAAVNGISGVFKPVITTILTTFLAFAPMFFMSGMLGKFVWVIPLTISLALLISLGEVIIGLPAHLVPGLRRIKPTSKSISGRAWFRAFRKVFQAGLYRFLRLRYLFVLLSMVVLAASLWLVKNHMDFILFPSKGADYFSIVLRLPVGSSIDATADKMTKVDSLIMELPDSELSSFVTRIGGYGDVVDFEGEHYAGVAVNLTPFSKRNRTADDIVEELRGKIDALGEFEHITFYVDAGGPPVGKPVVIRIVGSDDAMRRVLADSVEAYLSRFEGAKDIERDDNLGKEQVEIVLNYDKIARLGMTVVDIARTVRIAYDGEVVTSIRYGDEDVDFRVILQERARKSLKFLRQLQVPNRQGRLIPLGEVARLKITAGPSDIHHYNSIRSTTVSSDVDQEITTAMKATQAVQSHFELDRDYPGMRFVTGGEAQEQAESMQSLFVTFAVAALAIYLMLILLFDSITQPILVMFAIPFGIVGVIIAFYLHDEALSFLAMLGAVGLAGVVVNDSLVLVNHLNELRRQKPDEEIRSIVAEGTANRLRAILMTTLTTVVGLLPLAYGIGGLDVYMYPMALALGYGLLFSTPLTLLLVPSLYIIGNDIGRLFWWRKRRILT
jgi:multidrug efflux pump subunit AcrB